MFGFITKKTNIMSKNKQNSQRSAKHPHSHLLKKRGKRLRGFRRQVTNCRGDNLSVKLTQNLKFIELTVSTCAIFKTTRCCAWIMSYKVPLSAPAAFNLCSIIAFHNTSGRPDFALILLPAFPPPSDDFEASYAVAFRGVARRRWIWLPWKRLRERVMIVALQLFAELDFL